MSDTQQFSYCLIHQDGFARLGEIHTPRGRIRRGAITSNGVVTHLALADCATELGDRIAACFLIIAFA